MAQCVRLHARHDFLEKRTTTTTTNIEDKQRKYITAKVLEIFLSVLTILVFTRIKDCRRFQFREFYLHIDNAAAKC